MPNEDELEAEWTGHDLFDLDGGKIGTVEDVHFGDSMDDPNWLVVETGILGWRKILVPAVKVRRAGDRLSVPFTKDRVKDAPKVDNEMTPTDAEQGRLCRYYGLQYAVPAGGSMAECEEMDTEDTHPAG
jgi:PRC-barrel domain